MGDKKSVASNKMSVTDINDPLFAGKSARKMARDLMAKYHRAGENYDTTAFNIQKKYGVDADVIMQGWNREPRGMLTHRWLPLFQAWVASGLARVDQLYEDERARHDENSALVRLADLVAGKEDKRAAK